MNSEEVLGTVPAFGMEPADCCCSVRLVGEGETDGTLGQLTWSRGSREMRCCGSSASSTPLESYGRHSTSYGFALLWWTCNKTRRQFN